MEFAEVNRTKTDSTNDKTIIDYLIKHEAVFRDLCEQKRRGWSSTEGDNYFQDRQERADNTTAKTRNSFFRMTVGIGDEVSQRTNAFNLQSSRPLVLDLCMAPGGFTKSVMKRCPNVTVHAITLPPERGGHHVMLEDANLSVVFADITMYVAEFGLESIPKDHPDANDFSMDRPYLTNRYDLVFCGGAVLRTHKRAEYRAKVEGPRLTLSQLIFAFQRISIGGTLVLLLHRVETWNSLRIIYTLSQFADIQLFKPRKAHSIKSSFYVIAKNVQPQHPEAVKAVSGWKYRWCEMTCGIWQGDKVDEHFHARGETKDVSLILNEFGPRLRALGRPIWRTQAEALKTSGFLGTTS